MFLTSPTITAIRGPLVVFAACEQRRAVPLAPARARSSSHQPQRRFLPLCLPAAPNRREHISMSIFFSSVTPKGVGVVYEEVCQRQFSGYQNRSPFRRLPRSAPVLQKLQPNFSLPLWVPVHGKSSDWTSVTQLFFQLFLWVKDLSSTIWQGGEDLTCGFISLGKISWGCGYPRDVLACSKFKGVLQSHLPGACQ